jgi:hypothetical protein
MQESIKKCGAVGFNGMGRHSAGSGQEIGGLGCPTLFDALQKCPVTPLYNQAKTSDAKNIAVSNG